MSAIGAIFENMLSLFSFCLNLSNILCFLHNVY